MKIEVSIIGLLGVAFVVLKLTDVIDWSWWLVTLPFWWPFGGFALLLAGLALLMAGAAVFDLMSTAWSRPRRRSR